MVYKIYRLTDEKQNSAPAVGTAMCIACLTDLLVNQKSVRVLKFLHFLIGLSGAVTHETETTTDWTLVKGDTYDSTDSQDLADMDEKLHQFRLLANATRSDDEEDESDDYDDYSFY